MPSTKYEQLWQSAQDIFDDVFGARFSFQPMREVKNAMPLLDPDRSPIASVTGIPVIDGYEQTVGGQWTQRTISAPKFSFQASEFPQGIQRFDRLQRISGPTNVMNRMYEVVAATPEPEGIYRIVVECKEIGELAS